MQKLNRNMNMNAAGRISTERAEIEKMNLRRNSDEALITTITVNCSAFLTIFCC